MHSEDSTRIELAGMRAESHEGDRSTTQAIKNALTNPAIANITTISPTDPPWINDQANKTVPTRLSGIVRYIASASTYRDSVSSDDPNPARRAAATTSRYTPAIVSPFVNAGGEGLLRS